MPTAAPVDTMAALVTRPAEAAILAAAASLRVMAPALAALAADAPLVTTACLTPTAAEAAVAPIPVGGGWDKQELSSEARSRCKPSVERSSAGQIN